MGLTPDPACYSGYLRGGFGQPRTIRYTRICSNANKGMRVSYSLGSLLPVDKVIECARVLSGTDADAIWVPETWGMENFAMLGAISQINQNCKIGSSIVNIYSRSPATIAMGAATIDTLSRGRLILGLGTSSLPIIEDFHGYKFKRPLPRMKEYVEIVRQITATRKAGYLGEIFRLENFSLLIKPYRSSIPVYLAAVNKRMVELAWDIADGVIFYLRPVDEIRRTVSKMQSRRKINVSCQLITCVSNDIEAAICRAKKTLAFYISVGTVYREFLERNGFAVETRAIFDTYQKLGLGSTPELVSDRMVNSLAVAGTPEHCKKQLLKFYEAGVDTPILQFNPVGDMTESFKLLTDTFSEVR